MNNRLSLAVAPKGPSRPGSMSLIRSHWSSLSVLLSNNGIVNNSKLPYRNN